jgi:hypothetical protein
VPARGRRIAPRLPDGPEERTLMTRLLTTTLLCASLVICAAATAARRGTISPSDFVARVTNPWFPLRPGTTFVYTGVKDGRQTRDVVTVTHETRRILGVRTTVVHDVLSFGAHVGERTRDYYAQDRQGNVWYFGEDTAELDAKGHVTSREGTWLAGRNGARPGIYITGSPRVGQSARQEYLHGSAEDHFEVVSLESSVSVPYVTSHHALLTKEWTPLEPRVLDHKYYVRGIGNVKEASVKGPKETNVLVSVRRR